MDHQIKFHGMRIELGEIETVLCEITGASRCVATGLTNDDGSVSHLAAIVECDVLNEAQVRSAALDRLPGYMVPKVLGNLDTFPLTSNGKVDRKALVAMLDAN